MDIAGNHGGFAQETDVPVAGLLADPEARGRWASAGLQRAGIRTQRYNRHPRKGHSHVEHQHHLSHQ